MKRVQRAEILDYVTYEEQRDQIRDHAMAQKAVRRVHAGDVLTFLFENTVTIRYQVLEMVRAERMVREADIAHELETYNELLGGPGELGCTLLIEIDNAEMRDRKLREWTGVPAHLYVRLEDGTKVYAMIDARQNDERRVSTVQYLRFPVNGQTPVAVGCDDPALTAEAKLTPEQRAALREDLTDRAG